MFLLINRPQISRTPEILTEKHCYLRPLSIDLLPEFVLLRQIAVLVGVSPALRVIKGAPVAGLRHCVGSD